MQGGGAGARKKPSAASMSEQNSVHGEQSPSLFGPLSWPEFIPQAGAIILEMHSRRENHKHLSNDRLANLLGSPSSFPILFLPLGFAS